jgi:hypothetical protein
LLSPGHLSGANALIRIRGADDRVCVSAGGRAARIVRGMRLSTLLVLAAIVLGGPYVARNANGWIDSLHKEKANVTAALGTRLQSEREQFAADLKRGIARQKAKLRARQRKLRAQQRVRAAVARQERLAQQRAQALAAHVATSTPAATTAPATTTAPVTTTTAATTTAPVTTPAAADTTITPDTTTTAPDLTSTGDTTTTTDATGDSG